MPGAEGNGRWRPTKTAKYGVGKQLAYEVLAEMVIRCSQFMYNCMQYTRESILREGSTGGGLLPPYGNTL